MISPSIKFLSKTSHGFKGKCWAICMWNVFEFFDKKKTSLIHLLNANRFLTVILLFDTGHCSILQLNRNQQQMTIRKNQTVHFFGRVLLILHRQPVQFQHSRFHRIWRNHWSFIQVLSFALFNWFLQYLIQSTNKYRHSYWRIFKNKYFLFHSSFQYSNRLQYFLMLTLKNLLKYDRNLQIMATYGFAQHLLYICESALQNENHHLHTSAEYIFERLAAFILPVRTLR